MDAIREPAASIEARGRRSAWASRKAPRRAFATDHVLRREDLGIYALSDGEGEGAPADAAASAVLRTLATSLSSWALSRHLGPVEAAVDALEQANRELCHLASAQNGYPTMSASAGLLLIEPRAVVFAAVGDVALFRRRHGVLQRVCPRWIRARRLGLTSEVPVEAMVLTSAPGDVLMLASDGLHAYLPPSADTRLILAQGPELAANYLAAHAHDVGSEDDASAIVVELPSAGPSTPLARVDWFRRPRLR